MADYILRHGVWTTRCANCSSVDSRPTSATAFLHVSLVLSHHYQAKELGTMIETASEITDWQPTSIPAVFSHWSRDCWRATTQSPVFSWKRCGPHLYTWNTSVLYYPGTSLDSLPSWCRKVRSLRIHCPEGHSAPWHLDYRTFWCRSLQNKPISFQMDIANPICRPQYKVSPEAAERLRNPIEVVLRAINQPYLPPSAQRADPVAMLQALRYGSGQACQYLYWFCVCVSCCTYASGCMSSHCLSYSWWQMTEAWGRG